VSTATNSFQPTFSLVLATLGEGRFIVRFLESLLRQGAASFELIVVDQNQGDHVQQIIGRYRDRIAIRSERSPAGLSLARNCGIKLARGRIIAFPDDDCWYRPGLLADVEQRLQDPSLAGLTCRCTDKSGRLAAGGDDREGGRVSKRNVWRRGVSATMFLRRNLVLQTGSFDETLGLGSGTAFQSGEETDFLLRAIRLGHKIHYDPSLAVYHPLPVVNDGATMKSHAYGLGMGRVLRMHNYPLPAVLAFLTLPLLGAAYARLRGQPDLARVRLARAKGRLSGWVRGLDRESAQRTRAPHRPGSSHGHTPARASRHEANVS
jgi:glycosyltransferase involved in cell wall biosynthesis